MPATFFAAVCLSRRRSLSQCRRRRPGGHAFDRDGRRRISRPCRPRDGTAEAESRNRSNAIRDCREDGCGGSDAASAPALDSGSHDGKKHQPHRLDDAVYGVRHAQGADAGDDRRMAPTAGGFLEASWNGHAAPTIRGIRHSPDGLPKPENQTDPPASASPFGFGAFEVRLGLSQDLGFRRAPPGIRLGPPPGYVSVGQPGQPR